MPSCSTASETGDKWTPCILPHQAVDCTRAIGVRKNDTELRPPESEVASPKSGLRANDVPGAAIAPDMRRKKDPPSGGLGVAIPITEARGANDCLLSGRVSGPPTSEDSLARDVLFSPHWPLRLRASSVAVTDLPHPCRTSYRAKSGPRQSPPTRWSTGRERSRRNPGAKRSHEDGSRRWRNQAATTPSVLRLSNGQGQRKSRVI